MVRRISWAWLHGSASARVSLAALLTFVTLGTGAFAQTTWHVDDDVCPAFGAGTVEDPYCRIADALNAAADGDTVLVARGTYAEAVVILGKTVHLLAADGPESTIITGDTKTSPVVRLQQASGRMKGFTVDGPNAGLQVINGSPIVEDCIITGNQAENGAGLELSGASRGAGNHPTIRNCTIQGNRAVNTGGGILCSGRGGATIEGCLIESNTAAQGGGIYVVAGPSVNILNCTIRDNEASGSAGGAALSVGRGARVTMDGCIVSGNRAKAGAGINCSEGRPTISNCTIEDNVAVEIAGGINCKSAGSPSIANCVIRNNVAQMFNGGGMTIQTNSHLLITDTRITGNRARNGGGVYVFDQSSPIFRDCTISNNIAEPMGDTHGYGGGLALGGGQPYLFRCLISGNQADSAGGIGLTDNPNSVVFDTIVADNVATRVGGGVLCNHTQAQLANVLIVRNRAGFHGGGVYNYNEGSPMLIHCTVADNTAEEGSGIFGGAGSNPTLVNSVVWSNSGAGMDFDDTSDAMATCCDIQGGWPGEANIASDPVFVGGGNYRLRAESACIHACPVIGFGKGKETDLTGRSRRPCSASDMGAYEFGPGDYNCDRRVTLADFAGWVECETGPSEFYIKPACEAVDDEGSGTIDLYDFAAFQNAFTTP